MSSELYACVYAAEFPAQTLLRLRPELRSEPLAVLEGRAPLEAVCSMNTRALRKGAVRQMTRVEAEAIPSLRLLSRSAESEASARTVLMECAARFSPRIEDISGGEVCSCALDITGMERLFGPPDAIARHIRDALKAAGFQASVAVSANFHAARIKAVFTRGIAVIAKGEEASALAPLPIQALCLPDERVETFASWGIRTLGELAALDTVDLISRLGPEAERWRELAVGSHAHTFQPVEPEFQLSELCEFEAPVEQIESLLFVGSRMIDCLVDRAASRALSLARISAHMKLEGGQTHVCTIRPGLPSTDRKFLLKLLQLGIAAHPPQRGVIALTLSAEAGASGKVQLGLFAPQTPEPSQLDVTIARLKAIVGAERVGSPMLEDTHRAGGFRMEGFAADGRPAIRHGDRPRLALRRMRPPMPVHVVLCDAQPAAFRDNRERYEVEAVYGPWMSSGCWWSVDSWHTEEWDVLAIDGSGTSVACLLVSDRTRTKWHLEAFYD